MDCGNRGSSHLQFDVPALRVLYYIDEVWKLDQTYTPPSYFGHPAFISRVSAQKQGKSGIFFVVELGIVVSALILAWLFRKEKALVPKGAERTVVTE